MSKIKFIFSVGVLFAVVVFTAMAAEEMTLQLGATGVPLVTPNKGEKTFRVTIQSRKAIESARLKAEWRAYTVGGNIEEKVAVKNEIGVSLSEGMKEVELTGVLPELGLYEVTVSVLDGAGKSLATQKVNYAAVPPRSEVGPSDFGICTHLGRVKNVDSVRYYLDLIKLAGFSRIRDERSWSGVERKMGEFVFPPAEEDYVTLAVGVGLSPVLVLDYLNGTYADLFKGSGGFPKTDAQREAFVRYVAESVKHYGDKVKFWEVWNEPHAWGKVGPDVYLQLLKPVYKKIKELDPDATVISCGGGGAGGGPGGDYINGIVGNGGLNFQDGFSVHPYMSPNTPELGYGAKNAPIPRASIPVVWPHLGRFVDNEKHRLANGKKLSIWVTEYGWPSSPQSYFNGETMQAAYLTRSYLLSRRYGRVEAVFWYDFCNDGVQPNNPEHNFGLLRQDLSPKPSYVAASVLTWTLGARAFNKPLIENDNIKILQYGEGEESILVGWTVMPYREVMNIKIAPGTYTLRDWQGHEKTVEVAEKGYDWKVGPLPEYLFLKTESNEKK